jgi:hypothetical protein
MYGDVIVPVDYYDPPERDDDDNVDPATQLEDDRDEYERWLDALDAETVDAMEIVAGRPDLAA